MTSSRKPFANGFLIYFVAALLIVAASVLRHVLTPYVGSGSVFLLYILPVVISALLGGLGPALFATMLGGLLGTVLFTAPQGDLYVASSQDLARLTIFLLTGTGISLLGHQLVRSRQAQALTERKFKTLVSQSQDTAIFLIGTDGKVESWNRGAEVISGYSADEAIGRHISIFQPPEPDGAESTQALFLEAAEKGNAGTEGWRLRKDGSRFWANFRLSALRDESGKLIGFSSVTQDRTREHDLLSRYQESEQTATALLESATQAVVGIGLDGRIRLVNRTTSAIFGYAQEELVGQELEILIPEAYRASHVHHRAAFFKEGGSRPMGHGLDLQGRRRDGTVFPVEASLSLTSTPSGPMAVAFVNDISRRKQIEKALLQEQSRLRSILDHAPVLISIRDLDGRYVVVNRRLAEVFGVSEESMTGKTPHALFAPAVAERVLEDDGMVLASGETIQTEEAIAHPDGKSCSYLTVKYPVRFLHTDAPFGVCSISLDISRQKEAEERAVHAAQHDPLTGLPNRSLVYEFGQRLISSAHRNQHRIALLFFDLDRFKPINDTYGHAVGDRMLQEVAQRLKQSLRGSDVVGRIGGDEFVAILDKVYSENHVAHVAANLLEALRKPYQVGELELRTSPSIGISMYTPDGADIDTLLRNADAAMYYAKSNGRNTFQFFTPEIDRSTKRVFELEQRLRQSMDDSDFELFYQPVVDTRTRNLVSAEALVRWRQKNDRVLLPADFIAAAEASGLIHQLGRWVIRRACEQHREWQDQGLPALRIAVNVSPLQFRAKEFQADIADALRSTGTDPQWFELEVTESTVMKQVEEAVRTLSGLKQIGVSISLDDFGTGYSSLSYLTQLPIDKIKVDQSFVRNIDTDARSLAITETVIAMAQKLNMEVVAEGIESEGALNLLSDRQCGLGQGYFIGRPMTSADFVTWYHDHAARPVYH